MKSSIKVLVPALFISMSALADKARLLGEDRDALQARVDIIQQAKKEILVEYYSVWNDDQSIGGFALLVEAAKRGVKVKVIMDALSNSVPRSLLGALEEKGRDAQGNLNLEIKVYNPLSFNLAKATHRDHAKMLIADGETMISGGRNVGDKYFGLNSERNFQDMDAIMSGQVVSNARTNYLTVWKNESLTKKPELYENSPEKLTEGYCMPSQDNYDSCERTRLYAQGLYNKEIERINTSMQKLLKVLPGGNVNSNTNTDWLKGVDDNYEIQMLGHDATGLVNKKSNTMADQLSNLALSAKKEINIISPYLVPTPGLFQVFENLISRGITVKIITNSLRSTDNLFAQAAYRADKKRLIALGIEIYEFNGPDTIHAKVAVIDGSTNAKTAMIGTYNLDPRSSSLNREVGFAITTKNSEHKFADDLTSRIELMRKNTILVGKDRIEYNADKEFEGVSDSKKALLKAVSFVLPAIRNQI